MPQPTDPSSAGNVIPLPQRAPRRQIVRRTVAPVVDVMPRVREKRRNEDMVRIGSELAELLGEYRRLKGRGPYFPDDPGSPVAL